ncbi:low temperature requirement protein A [Nocardia terpenica]|uniref:Low temperature requirement protein A n=1 Tax=Nocardia terpenica TaxID=455432 RepID=A0A6G9Z1D0_9NOCA|nr:low temperature requirement protein A [Nocardia terpenica]QIS19318.1 low temperature requirement protein A [Nocardia terpenica]
MTSETADAAEGGQVRASTLELFFDLVFVFTITQLTHAFSEHASWAALGRVALMFGVIWWMYSGYVWLTNEVAPNSSARRTALLIGMLGFFILAVAVPEAAEGSGIAFGVGYFVVNTVHTALFYIGGGASATSAILRIAPPNAASALLVLGGGFVHGWPRYLIWGAAFALQVVTPYIAGIGGFVVRPSHFCERHGLVLIIAIGESVVAIGAGLGGEHLDAGLIGMIALGLWLAYVLWWAFFGLDDERGEHAMAALPGPRRTRPAVVAYGYSLYVMLLGIILTAAGIKICIADGTRPMPLPAALALAGGVGVFFLGQCLFRLTLRLPRPWWRLAAAAAAVATTPLGVTVAAWILLAALVIVAYVFVIADDVLSMRSGDHSAYL